jgi:putative oxidoreductase
MRRGLNIALWITQVLLALAFVLRGTMKLTSPASQLLPMFGATPVLLIRFIGVAEIGAAAGLLLPSVTRLFPIFTPLAATGLAMVMFCAAFFHISQSEWTALPGVLLLGALAAFTAWGRLSAAPISPR